MRVGAGSNVGETMAKRAGHKSPAAKRPGATRRNIKRD